MVTDVGEQKDLVAEGHVPCHFGRQTTPEGVDVVPHVLSQRTGELPGGSLTVGVPQARELQRHRQTFIESVFVPELIDENVLVVVQHRLALAEDRQVQLWHVSVLYPMPEAEDEI